MWGANEGSTMVITHNSYVDSPSSSAIEIQEQPNKLRLLRHQLLLHYRPILQQGAGPIRVMARMVADLERQCREQGIAQEIVQSELVNRTIGDVNLRLVTECEGEPGGPGDYRMLAEELGVALPGENVNGYVAPVTTEQVHLGLGAIDSINKVLCGLAQMYREQHAGKVGILFPEPGFAVPEWQARSFDYHLYNYLTFEENRFKLTALELEQLLANNPAIRVIYLTVTNNPTTFAYSPEELNAIHAVLGAYRKVGREVFILADLAYIGTGKPEEDRARMATFAQPDVLENTIFVSSFSKTYTLTGERFGWVTAGDPAIAAAIAPGWSNTMASLPAEWQLRFMAYIRLMQARPWLKEKLRALYRLRRQRFIEQLRSIDEELHLFDQIYIDDDATVYNWSKLRPGEDAFSMFEKTGIAGVPGSGFGYTDEYVRFSIGVIPVPEVSSRLDHRLSR